MTRASDGPRQRPCHRGGGRRRLFWRVYLHGVMLLVLAISAAAVIAHTVGPPNPFHGMLDRVCRTIATSAAKAAAPGELQRELDRVREDLDLGVSVYQLDGKLIATSIRPPVVALARARLHRVKVGKSTWIRGRFAIGIERRDQVIGYALVAAPRHRAIAGKALLMLAAVLVVLALGSVPLVRWIIGPLERLTATARQLGMGDLSARTGITRRDEVGQLAGAFDEMAGRLDRLLSGERQLLANISHELRTPLARIRVALELAAEQGGAGDARQPGTSPRYLAEIGTDLAELETLIEDVLTTARLDLAPGGSQQAVLRVEAISGEELIERATERFAEAHPGRQLTVEVTRPLPVVAADPRLLPRVIDNLLHNAHKHAGEQTSLRLGARTGQGGTLVVEVVDAGPGIDPEDLPHLFEPFFRADRSRARDSGGVGLGLALARRIVEAHAGTINAESTPGEGTTLRFEIPRAAS